jgi:preprotein translocase subunit SecB
MKAVLSPLRLLDFAILNSNLKFLVPEQEINIPELIASYPIDIDFAIVEEQDKNTRVFIKASVNHSKPVLSGYSIFAEGVAVFSLSDKKALSKEDRDYLLQYSAVSIALNSLRGYIISLTANAPFGRYILPSIDVNALFKEKINTIQETKKKASTNKKMVIKNSNLA